MNSYERVFARLAGKPVDKIPNLCIVMAFAAKTAGYTYKQFATDYRVLVDSNIKTCEEYGIDMVSCISDPCREASGFGAEIVFPEDDSPFCKDELIKEYSDLKSLSAQNPLNCERMIDRIRAVELYKQQVGGVYPILGWVEGAFAEANDLRGINNIMMDIYEEPNFVKELLELTTEQAIAFAREQIKAGAEFIGVGDAAASLIGPDNYREFVLPYEKRLFDEIHKMGARVKLHICGNITPILSDIVQSGADIVDVDWMVDFKYAVQTLGDSISACGNFDPVEILLRGAPETVKGAVQACVDISKSNTLIAAGCEVPRDTPDENMRAVGQIL